mmetsp:Transcript_27256/g.76846  ORF Transcript_27256/g.76846 Transcript_27256/m.76846 type:complete len:214 (+) Transcript_27256:2214-2855(+)
MLICTSLGADPARRKLSSMAGAWLSMTASSSALPWFLELLLTPSGVQEGGCMAVTQWALSSVIASGLSGEAMHFSRPLGPNTSPAASFPRTSDFSTSVSRSMAVFHSLIRQLSSTQNIGDAKWRDSSSASCSRSSSCCMRTCCIVMSRHTSTRPSMCPRKLRFTCTNTSASRKEGASLAERCALLKVMRTGEGSLPVATAFARATSTSTLHFG